MGVFSQLRNQTLRLWHDVPLPTREADATPVFQQWHKFNSPADAWTPLDSPSTTTTTTTTGTERRSHDNKFVLVTWNIDASSSAPEARISALISHIQNLTTPADIIFVQEVSRPALSALLETPWIRENWYSSEADTAKWGKQPFASMTLVSRAWLSHSGPNNVTLGPVWRVNYPTHFQRDALCCDVFLLPSNGSTSSSSSSSSSRVRLVNVHLDSLPINPSLRPRQLAIIASYLRAAGHGLVAGDFNPVLPEDDALVGKNGLVDAWTELHPEDDGFTWGVDGDAPFPPSRLDKVAMVGLEASDIQVLPPGKIELTGVLKHEGNNQDDQGLAVKWSDHSGLVCSVGL